MKQVININFQGSVVPIEVTAFETLKNYTESLRRYFSNEEGRDEIINDIESRIAELFQERLKAGSTCITDDDVNAIMASMGRPEDFEEVTGAATAAENKKFDQQQKATAEPQQPGAHKRLFRDENNKVLGGVCSGLANYFGLDPVVVRIIFVILFFAAGFGILPYIIFWVAVPSSATTVIGGSRKKFYRDPDDKIVAGVCSGIGNYFGINPWIPRVLFLLPFISVIFRWGHWGFYDFPSFLSFSFSPGSVIVYIILWLVVPEAFTTSEKLEMKGEKINMNSIKNSVVEEMKGVGQRAEKFGEEAKVFAEEKAKVLGAEVGKAAKRSRSSLGDVIALFAKGFGYFIISVVCFFLVIGLFTAGIFSIGVFPLKDYVIRDGWQNVFAWGTLLFFIAVPIIGIITWIIRRIAKIKGKSKMVRWAFGSLWVVGWICVIFLLASLSSDFRRSNHTKLEEVSLVNPTIGKLEVAAGSRADNYFRRRGLRFQPFTDFEPGDTLYVNNVDINIIKSTNDSFKVILQKFCNGYRQEDADTTAALMNYPVIQKDSILVLPKGIPITEKSKFRNQQVRIEIYVPVGKQIRINNNTNWNNNVHFGGPFRDYNWYDEDYDLYEHGWENNVDYIMTAKGLSTLDGKMVDENKYPSPRKKRNANPETYRYNDSIQPALNRIDSIKMKQKLENKKMLDSIEKSIQKTDAEKEKLEKMKEKLDDGDNDPEAFRNVLPMDSPVLRTI
ncbi:MAG: PspC domain-containing protein [Ferruginibacter sp.]